MPKPRCSEFWSKFRVFCYKKKTLNLEQNSEFWSYEELWIEEEFEEIEDTEDTEEIRENPGPAAFGYT